MKAIDDSSGASRPHVHVGKQSTFRPELLRLRLLLFALLADLLLIVSPVNTFVADKLLLFPVKELANITESRKVMAERYKIDWQTTNFPGKNGNLINAWYLKIPGAQKTYLFNHGNSGNISHRLLPIAALLESGGSVFIYDFQGFGQSQGLASYKTLVEDGVSAYDYLVGKEGVKPEEIVSYGESLGCAVASKVMANRKVGGVVLQSGFSSLVEAARDRCIWTRIYPEILFPQRFLDNTRDYRGEHPPLLILHGARDLVLPIRYAERVYKEASEPKNLEILPECGHGLFLNDVPTTIMALKSHLARLDKSQAVH